MATPEYAFRISADQKNAAARAAIQQQRDSERQDRFLQQYLMAHTKDGVEGEHHETAKSFNVAHYVCGQVCPMENVQDTAAFELRRQYQKGLYTEREVISKTAGLLIVSCLDMQKNGDCLYAQD